MRACTVFTTALCNLNCSYCYICKDKNGGLALIDKDIEESFNNNEFINNIVNFDKDTKNTLEHVTLWGGEPFLGIDRFINQLPLWFNTFPKLEHFNTSTNFTIPNQVEKIKRLFDAIDKYGPKSTYTFELQISIDGYPEMTDFGRGKGVTNKILSNWNDLLNMQYNKDKIILTVITKPTLSRDTFVFLDSKEKCEKWFTFFSEKMFVPYDEKGRPFTFCLALFNCATPTEWTQEDGYEFAKIIGYLSELNPKDYPGWETFHSLSPLSESIIRAELNGENYSMPRCGGICGAFATNIVPIPKGKYSVCHRGLFDNYVDYCNNTNNIDYMNGLSKDFFAPKDRNKWLLNIEDLRKMHHTMGKMNECNNQILFTDYIISIREYARAGIIDSKYMDINNIQRTLSHYLSNSYCMQDGLVQNGSWTTVSTYEIPLMYNGAMDIAIKTVDKYMENYFGGQ
jgi:organic radical activating enzyme